MAEIALDEPFRETIRESDYGDSPHNLHIDRCGNVLTVEMTYPNITDAGVTTIEIDQESVRASDGIRVTYDYDRDGWSIQQPKSVLVWHGPGPKDFHTEDDGWQETAFVRSWALDPEKFR